MMMAQKKLKSESPPFVARNGTLQDGDGLSSLLARVSPEIEQEQVIRDLNVIAKYNEQQRTATADIGKQCAFVVEDVEDGGMIGFVSGVQKNPFEFEIVHLIVDLKHSENSLGEFLIEMILDFAGEHIYERVIAAKRGADEEKWYEKVGFHRIAPNRFWKNVFNTRKVSKVSIVGGTHGNELIGVHLVQGYWKNSSHPDFLSFPSLSIIPCLANEDAAKRNVRYVDRDLNRCFELDELLSPEKVDVNLETKRARWLNSFVLGPKCDIQNSIGYWKKEHPGRTDYMIDLHSTTSNMGISLISLAGDQLTVRLAYALSEFFKSRPDLPPFHLLLDFDCPRTKNNNIDSVTPSAICIEVGPLSHGTLNNTKLYDGTKHAVLKSLEHIEQFNKRELDAEGFCEDVKVQGYSLWKPLYYPRESTDSFTIQATIHPDRIGKDFQKVEKGDPLLIDLNTGRIIVYEEDEPAYPCFIGEAAYFLSGIAMWLCRKGEFPVHG